MVSSNEFGVIIIVVLSLMFLYFVFFRESMSVHNLEKSRSNVRIIQKNLDTLATLDFIYPDTQIDIDNAVNALISDLKRLDSKEQKLFCKKISKNYIYSQIRVDVCDTMTKLGYKPHKYCNKRKKEVKIEYVIALLEWMYTKHVRSLTVRIANRRFAIKEFKDSSFTSNTRAKLQTISKALETLIKMAKSEICNPKLNLKKTENALRNVLFYKLENVPTNVAKIIVNTPIVSASPASSTTPVVSPVINTALNKAASAGASSILDNKTISPVQTSANAAVVVNSLKDATQQIEAEASKSVSELPSTTSSVSVTPPAAVAQEVNELTRQKTTTQLAQAGAGASSSITTAVVTNTSNDTDDDSESVDDSESGDSEFDYEEN